MEQETDYPYKAYDGTFAYKEICDVQVSAFTDDTVKSPQTLWLLVLKAQFQLLLMQVVSLSNSIMVVL